MFLRISFILFLFVVICGLAFGQGAPNSQTEQIDEFSKLNSEDHSGRLDHFFHQLQKNPSSRGVVILFCGKLCHYGETESHIRGIELKTRFRRFDLKRLDIIVGGYRDDFTTQLWIVPPGGTMPEIRATLSIKDVTFAKAKASFVTPYECCDDTGEMWNEYKKDKKKK